MSHTRRNALLGGGSAAATRAFTLNEVAPGDPRDTTTPVAMLTDLRGAMLGTLLRPPQPDQLIGWMRRGTTGLGRIQAAVPAAWLVADKTGSGDCGTANDIAVVWPLDRAPIVLIVCTT